MTPCVYEQHGSFVTVHPFFEKNIGVVRVTRYVSTSNEMVRLREGWRRSIKLSRRGAASSWRIFPSTFQASSETNAMRVTGSADGSCRSPPSFSRPSQFRGPLKPQSTPDVPTIDPLSRSFLFHHLIVLRRIKS